ncbi:hypothetical protein ABZZ79_22850 [Streptomyces sp. NPDC006458]|uniref:hypothetical protein n=1 Tax=Streptomyces sp. NPDC006458 TaxID=3154302 RepID=UPI0033B5EF64
MADMWREDLDRERAHSFLPRVWVTTRGLRTHPPLRLPIPCVEHGPLSEKLGQTVHSLHTAAAS